MFVLVSILNPRLQWSDSSPMLIYYMYVLFHFILCSIMENIMFAQLHINFASHDRPQDTYATSYQLEPANHSPWFWYRTDNSTDQVTSSLLHVATLARSLCMFEERVLGIWMCWVPDRVSGCLAILVSREPRRLYRGWHQKGLGWLLMICFTICGVLFSHFECLFRGTHNRFPAPGLG